VQGQQVPECVDRHVHLRALHPLVAVVAGPAAALDGRPEHAAVEDRGGGLAAPALGQPEHGPEVVDDGLEAAGIEPAAGLLVDRLQGREVLGQEPPGGAGADDPPQGVEGVAEAMDVLAGVLGQEAEVGDDERPLGVRDIAGVELMSDHTLSYAIYWAKVHNTL
jgi:hypothetical protein